MAKNHLSLIFYLIINIVILTSCADEDDLNERFENLVRKFNNEEKMASEDSNLKFQSALLSDDYKFRRDSSGYKLVTNTNDDDPGINNFMFDDADILNNVLQRLQTRDVNDQKAMTNTFNGKLISCFIHSSSYSLLVGQKIYCFVILLKFLFSLATIRSIHSTMQRNQHHHNQHQQN